MKQGDVLEVEKTASSASVMVQFLLKARENTWSRAARRKMKQKAAQRHGDETGDPSEATRKRTLEVDAGQHGPNAARKKGRVEDDDSEVLERGGYKMVCTVSLLTQSRELDEASLKRWTLRVQWEYGKDEDREMFEGFASHIERKVSQGAQ